MSNSVSVSVNSDGFLVLNNGSYTGIILGSGLHIISGPGDPNDVQACPKGSLYLRTDGTLKSEYLYVNVDGDKKWLSFIAIP